MLSSCFPWVACARTGPGRQAWVQVARGSADVNGQSLVAGDGAAVSGADAVALAGRGAGEVLVFDLA